MSESLLKSNKLLKSKDFNSLKKGSQYFSSKFVYAFVKPNTLNLGRLGITSSRKTGNAVMRNTAKRHIREKFRLSKFKYLPFDIVLITRPNLKMNVSNSPIEFRDDIHFLFRKISKHITSTYTKTV